MRRTVPLLAATGVALALTTGLAHADAGSATGASGQTLTVSQTTGLARDGATLTVTGHGFDTGKGVYVAFCQDNGAGKAPHPCGGGADTSGKTGGSQWISSNPPPYGKGLAVPYGPGGTFSVQIKIAAKLNDAVDCTKVKCVVATRADHTRSNDRSQDVRVPVSFEGGSSSLPWIVGGAAAAVVVLGGGAALLVRRRRGGSAA
ncbi:hypothetical protein [Actinomadura atramentaria]|uniref:hypothetical protein n=1 Tax=Actinomadura atramentaria TaxID=1990 RepID=UPI0003A8CD6F|nr:hypothetical protein [Actinomadura atramentaria]